MTEINHFVSIEGLGRSAINGLIETADGMLGDIEKNLNIADGKILATVFFEPSTRTRLSFASAMNRLGGKVISFGDVGMTSVTKGEVLSDTIRIVDSYSDIIAMRHPFDGAAKAIMLYSGVPTINAGDGKHEHPTQTMLDLFTIYKEKGELDGLKVVAVGDLKYGRTVHSLAYALSQYDTEMVCISPESLRMPDYVINKLPSGWLRYGENLEDEVSDADVIYVTRIQKERFDDEGEYERVRGSYVIDAKFMKLVSDKAIIMHPLPRVDEIAYDVDADPRAVYFKQAYYGVPMRMAIIAGLLGLVDVRIPSPPSYSDILDGNCANLRCITKVETYLPACVDVKGNCYYCGSEFIKSEDSGELAL